MSGRKRHLIIALLAVFLLVPSSLLAEIHHVTILHTNDMHGHILPFTYYPSPETGGLAAQYTAVGMVRAEVEAAGGAVLVLSAGDINSGAPESDLLNAEPIVKGMNLIGYDAMALGNHEFDKPRGVLFQQKGWASFPFLAANVLRRADGKPLFDAYMIKKAGDLRVAVVGFTTPETPHVTKPGNTSDLEFADAAETALKLLGEVRGKADLVIALSHLGYYPDTADGRAARGDLALARRAPGFDVIVGGHTHTALNHSGREGDALIVQAGEFGVYLGRLDLEYDDEAKKVVSHTFTLMPLNLKRRVKYRDESYYATRGPAYTPHPKMEKLLVPYLERSRELLGRPVGKAAVPLVGERARVRSGETNLGNLITDVMRGLTGADVALQNGGGIRAGIARGPITYRDILAVLPFGNTIVTMELTGAQLKEVLQYAAGLPPGSGAWLHVSGLGWEIREGRAVGVTVGGEPLDPKRVYKVAANDFMAAGGDGYRMLKQGKNKYDTGFVVAEVVREYIEERKIVAPRLEGRLKIVP